MADKKSSLIQFIMDAPVLELKIILDGLVKKYDEDMADPYHHKDLVEYDKEIIDSIKQIIKKSKED